MIKTYIVAVLLAVSLCSGKELTMEEVHDLPHAAVVSNLESSHPAMLYAYAGRLFEEGEKDEAVFWFYAGQLRFRFDLMAIPNQDPSGGPALFSSLNFTIGQAINEWAGGDIDMWVSQIEKAMIWDQEKPNSVTSKKKYKQVYEELREGLNEMIKDLKENKEEYQKMRAENGLENRG